MITINTNNANNADMNTNKNKITSNTMNAISILLESFILESSFKNIYSAIISAAIKIKSCMLNI